MILCPVQMQIFTFCLLLDPGVDLRSARLWSPREINSLQVCLVVLLCGFKEQLQRAGKIFIYLFNLESSVFCDKCELKTHREEVGSFFSIETVGQFQDV